MTQDNQNGHHPQEEQQISGYRPGPAVPSIHDLAMIGEMGGLGPQWNLARELITGSKEPEEYLPRGVYTRKEIARRKRITARLERIKRRRGSNLKDAIWIGDQMSIALNGAGREDAKEVARAAAQIEARNEQRRQGFMNNINRPMNQNGN